MLLPLSAIIVFVGLPVAWWVITSTTALNDAISDLKAAGIPTTLHEIIPPPVPDAENAALIYEKAWTELGDLPKDICDVARALSEIPPKRWPASDRKALSEFLRSKADAVGLTKRAANTSKCRFPLDYQAGLQMELPHQSHMISLTKLMRLDATDRVGRGDFEGASESALAGMRVSRHSRTDAVLVSNIAGIACYAISTDALDTVLRLGEPTPGQLQSTLSGLEREAPETDMTRALAADMGVMCDIYDRFRTGAPIAGRPWKEEEGPPVWWLRLLLARDETLYLESMAGFLRLADKPYFESRDDALAIESRIERAPEWRIFLAKIVTPRGSDLFAAASRAEAQYQVLRLAVALMIYDKMHGCFPVRLDQLAPEIIPRTPSDPFSGKAYVYRREGKGFVVYSLDRNMKDDGGVSSRDVGKDKGDLVFKFTGKQ